MLSVVRDYAEPLRLGRHMVARVPVLAVAELAMRHSASRLKITAVIFSAEHVFQHPQ